MHVVSKASVCLLSELDVYAAGLLVTVLHATQMG